MIRLTLGSENTTAKEIPNEFGFRVLDKQFSSNGKTIGMSAYFQLAYRVTIHAQSSISTKNKINTSDFGFSPIRRMGFRNIKSSFQVGYRPFSTFSLGIGAHVNCIPIVYEQESSNSYKTRKFNHFEAGYSFFTAYRLKKFLL